MTIYDTPTATLRASRASVSAPPDLHGFWAAAIAADSRGAGPGIAADADSPLRTVHTIDITFSGAHGDPIKAWLHVPVGHREPLPTVVEFVGYGGGRGRPHERTMWAQAGYAHFVMDNRGQGASWRPGDTPDPHGSGPAHPGFLTRGIDDPSSHYYRRVVGDAVRAVEVAAQRPEVDGDRIAAAGTSQGGGIATATAALSGRVSALLADVPFLCDIVRSAELTDEPPYSELTGYLAILHDRAETAASTLAYFDAAALGPAAQAPALFSVALRDPICPPQGIYAAYNAYGGSKQIVEYPYNGHEGGGARHREREIRWLDERFRGTDSCGRIEP